MNFFSKCCFLGLLASSNAVLAVEPAEGWYLGALVGGNFAPGPTFWVNHPFVFTSLGPLPGKISYNVGVDTAFYFGYRCYKFRYEGEIYFSENDYSKITLNGFNIRENRRFPALSMHGSTSLVAGLFNVYYEFYDEDYSDTRWVPYVGLGLGYGNVNNQLRFYYNSFLLNQGRNKDTVSTPVGQAILGVNYFFTENFSLGTDMRYVGTKKMDTFDSSFSTANLNLLLNYSFDQPAY